MLEPVQGSMVVARLLAAAGALLSSMLSFVSNSVAGALGCRVCACVCVCVCAPHGPTLPQLSDYTPFFMLALACI